MKPLIAATLATALLATQAQALSCLRPDVARTFEWAAQADERYVVLLGTFSYDGNTEKRSIQINPVTVQEMGTFEGQYLGVEGFVDAPTLDVQINLQCRGPWCGSLKSDDTLLAFVQQTDAGYVLDVDPCFSTIFEPSDQNVARVQACMRGDTCEEVPF